MLKQDTNLYEILDLTPDATPEEIRDAYFRTKSTYTKDNAALYTIVSLEDREQILKELEDAYLVLSNPQKRREYDQKLGELFNSVSPPVNQPEAFNVISIDRVPPMEQNQETEEMLIPPSTSFAAPSFQSVETPPKFSTVSYSSVTESRESSIRGSELIKAPEFPSRNPANSNKPLGTKAGSNQLDSDLLQAIETEIEWTGQFLRRVREAHKISLEEMASITKVTKTYLTAIEEENFKKLPAPVYIRGFVIQVAKTLKLPHERVASSYLKRYHAAKAV